MMQRACDICRAGHNTVKRYGLHRQTAAHNGFPNTTWGAGSIDLCDSCWDRIAKTRMKPQRRNNAARERFRQANRLEVTPP